jgi:hypothetical protein
METIKPILLDSKNYKSYLPLDKVAFSWAFGGAMGDAGGVNIVCGNGESYYFNWAHGDLSEGNIHEILPEITECKLPVIGETNKVPEGWHHISLGFGNNLLIKEEYIEPLKLAWKQFTQSLKKDEYVILYNVWQQLVTDIVKRQIVS